jgi:ATP-binding protein involved in chromosome partitioning
VIENMSWFIAPDTGARYEVFAGGGGQALATDLGVPLLGQVPLESDVARAGDDGLPVVAARPDSAAAKELQQIAANVADAVGLARATG